MFHEAAEEAVSTNHPEKSGFWSDTTDYYVEVRPDEVQDVVENHEFWGKIKLILSRTIDSLQRVSDVGITPDPEGITAELREHGSAIVRESLRSDRKNLKESEYWRRHENNCWRRVYKGEETLRDDRYESLTSDYRSDAIRWTLVFSEYLQPTIDKLQEAVIRHDEKGLAEVRDLDDELTRLRERVEELKEYAP